MTFVLFPDAVTLVVDYLEDSLDDRGFPVPVGSRVPDPRPASFVRVMRAGGERRDLVTDNPRLIIEAWADTDGDADDLAQLCRALLHDLRGRVLDGVPVYKVEEAGGPADLPDPLSDQSRSTFIVQIALRGAKEPVGS